MAGERGGFAGARLIARATLRRQWVAIAAVTLLIGIAGTAVLATAAGARRTATVMNRFSAFSNNADVEINFGDISDAELRAFESDPAIEEIAPLRQFAIVFAGQSEFLPSAGALDERFGTVIDRARVIRGRLPDPKAVNEVAIGETLAARLGLDVGDQLTGGSYSVDDVETAFATGREPGANGPPIRLEVVGIVRRPLDLSSRGAAGGVVVMTPAFTRENMKRIGSFGGTLARARTATSTADLIEEARRRFKDQEAFSITPVEFETDGARNAIDVLTLALALFATIAAAAAIVFVAIVMNRQLGSAEQQQVQLSALGVPRRTRVLAVLLPALPMIFGGAALAVFGAAFASTLFPIGVARRAEPDPGFDIDLPVLGSGFLIVVAITLAIATITALRVTRPSSVTTNASTIRPSRVANSARRAGLPATTTTGIGYAFETGRGRAAVPVRSALLGAIVGVAGIAVVLVYSASFDHLVANPERYGFTYGFVRSDENLDLPAGTCRITNPGFAEKPVFSAAGYACYDTFEVEGRPVNTWGFRSVRGLITPAIIRGRAAQAPDEITLGGATLDAIGKRVGDQVEVATEAGRLEYRVVGQQVLPSPGSIDPIPIADNAGMTADGFERAMGTTNDVDFYAFATLANGKALSDFPPGDTPFGGTASSYVRVGDRVVMELPTVPDELIRVRNVGDLPTLLGAFLAFLGLAAVAHALFVSVRRRGHDLAILRALGFRRGQVRSTVTWEATALALVGLVVGLPIGVLIGRLAWTVVADNLGVVSTVTMPVAALVALAAATLAVVGLLGVLSSRRAVRVSPATALTVE
jgi:ABC-type lipoprotein release transport system permease subunit